MNSWNRRPVRNQRGCEKLEIAEILQTLKHSSKSTENFSDKLIPMKRSVSPSPEKEVLSSRSSAQPCQSNTVSLNGAVTAPIEMMTSTNYLEGDHRFFQRNHKRLKQYHNIPTNFSPLAAPPNLFATSRHDRFMNAPTSSSIFGPSSVSPNVHSSYMNTSMEHHDLLNQQLHSQQPAKTIIAPVLLLPSSLSLLGDNLQSLSSCGNFTNGQDEIEKRLELIIQAYQNRKLMTSQVNNILSQENQILNKISKIQELAAHTRNAPTSQATTGFDGISPQMKFDLSAKDDRSDSSTDKVHHKICRMESCELPAARRTPYCKKHSGPRKCEHDGCIKCAQGRTRFCIAHGGGRRCIQPGCNKGARDRKYCASHGGGRRCIVEHCYKLAVGGCKTCTAHGGGKRCKFDGCTKSAQSSSSFCVRHGGGRKCSFPTCNKVARGKSRLCMSHSTQLGKAKQGCETQNMFVPTFCQPIGVPKK